MPATEPAAEKLVILVHGLGANRWVMVFFERALRRAGFRVLNWGYRSVGSSIETLSAALQQEIRKITAGDDVYPIHFVTHSMGAIVLRHALQQVACPTLGRPTLGRIVMIAPPNQGSRVARWLAAGLGWLWLGWLCRALGQLSDVPKSFVLRLPPDVGGELGIIAGRRDWLVPLESTHLPCEREHVELPIGHNRLLVDGRVGRHVINFLRFGTFHPHPSLTTATTAHEPSRTEQQG